MDNNASHGEINAHAHLRNVAYASFPTNTETEGPTEKELSEMRAWEIKKIKQEHIQSYDHLQKQLEFYSLEKLFKGIIEPKSKFMQDYIMKYELGNPYIRDTEYKDFQLEINRICQCMTLIHREMNRILYEKSWKTTQGLQQFIEDMIAAYNAVHHYVEETYRRHKQELRWLGG
ncbi:hypothetical protein CHS0354_019577 [Potamilus streckersoni]|uniref:Uncharacterized protein n=1 Tax=Potamilus streckersoni TaxID=2493646 RepID=A0AAE0TFT5_9BIVA|nr:hypothetical protein CHS0354_019577 [Potamilus streckersoni]